jgi:hypothetical protein
MLSTKRKAVWAVVIGVCLGQASVSVAGGLEGTKRRVQGIITAVDGDTVTISPVQGRAGLTGRVDARRTAIAIDGRPAR